MASPQKRPCEFIHWKVLAASLFESTCSVIHKDATSASPGRFFSGLASLAGRSPSMEVGCTPAAVTIHLSQAFRKVLHWVQMPSARYHLWARYWPREWNVPVAWVWRVLCSALKPGLGLPLQNHFGLSRGGIVAQRKQSFPRKKKKKGMSGRRNL